MSPPAGVWWQSFALIELVFGGSTNFIIGQDDIDARPRQMPRIRRLDLARVELPDAHPAAGLGRSVEVYGFLVEQPDGVILVDTGVGYGNTFIDELYQPSRSSLAALVERAGFGLDDIVAVVNSHLHFDHCGQSPTVFDTRTAFYAQAAEFDSVEADRSYTDASWALGPCQRSSNVHPTATRDSAANRTRPAARVGHHRRPL